FRRESRAVSASANTRSLTYVASSFAAIALIASIAVCRPLHAADTPPAAAVEPPTLRLPEGARPTRYALTLTIVPGEAKSAGEVVIDVELDRPHSVLWLNAESLDVKRATTDSAATSATIVSGGDQFVGISLVPPLPAGRHRVTLAFEAEQSRNSTRGIFA